MLEELATGLIGKAYPLVEQLTDQTIEDLAEKGADAITQAVNDTETKWDNEGAEKLAILLRSVADRIDEQNGPGIGQSAA